MEWRAPGRIPPMTCFEVQRSKAHVYPRKYSIHCVFILVSSLASLYILRIDNRHVRNRTNWNETTSDNTLTKLRASLSSFPGWKKEVAVPLLPIRPVRPMRCTYSSMSWGRSKLITCFTSGMSRPRAATDVATSTGARPLLKSRSAASRSCCVLSLLTQSH